MARKVDEAADFVFVQLIEQEPGIYDKCHPDYTRLDKIDLGWERVLRIVESGRVFGVLPGGLPSPRGYLGCEDFLAA
jgi:hypothetical protein